MTNNEHYKKYKDRVRYPDPYAKKLKYTIDEVTEKMCAALVDYKANRLAVSFWNVMSKYDLSMGYMSNWLSEGERFPQLLDMLAEFRNIQQERIIENALNGKFNSGFAKFLLECNYGMMTSYQKSKLEQNQQTIDMDGSIKIGFADVVDDDINVDDLLDYEEEGH